MPLYNNYDSDSDSTDSSPVSDEDIDTMKYLLQNKEFSKRFLKKIMEIEEKPVCMHCGERCFSKNQLKKHLKKHKNHKYGIERLRSNKKFFCIDLMNNHLNWDILHDFSEVHCHFTEMEDAEQTSYCKLLLLTMRQIIY